MARKPPSSTEPAQRDEADEAKAPKLDEPGREGLGKLREMGAFDGRGSHETLTNIETARTRAASPFREWYEEHEEEDAG